MTGFTRRAAVLGALTVALLAVAPVPLASASAPEPALTTLTVTPNTDLVDFQIVDVTGTDYPPSHSVDLVQCVEDQGCDFSNLQVHFTDADGSYTASFGVRRILHLEGVAIDCATDQNCILVSIDITDLSTGAQAAITFDPDAPPAPDPNFHLVPDSTGHVRPDKGTARIGATLRCNRDQFIDADLVLTQVYNQRIFRSEVFISIACSRGTSRFAVTFRPVNGLFGEGEATVAVDAFSYGSGFFVEHHKKVTVTLVASGT
jgi:Neocarzinostatin family